MEACRHLAVESPRTPGASHAIESRDGTRALCESRSLSERVALGQERCFAFRLELGPHRAAALDTADARVGAGARDAGCRAPPYQRHQPRHTAAPPRAIDQHSDSSHRRSTHRQQCSMRTGHLAAHDRALQQLRGEAGTDTRQCLGQGLEHRRALGLWRFERADSP